MGHAGGAPPPAKPGAADEAPILASMVTAAGYVRVRLNRDLATLRAIKPYFPPVPI